MTGHHNPILQQLKAETAEIHSRLDSSLPLTSKTVTREGYVAVLSGLQDAVTNAEAELNRHANQLSRYGHNPVSQRLEWLTQDLTHFEAVEIIEPITPPNPLGLPTPAHAFGAIYVLEGSALGGRYIINEVAEPLEIVPPAGCRYFHGYGPETGARWRQTCDALTAFAATGNQTVSQAMIDGARATFLLFEQAISNRLKAAAVGELFASNEF